MNDELESKIEEAIKNPRNLGEMKDADAVGTVGSADCGDMLRMWIKFKEETSGIFQRKLIWTGERIIFSAKCVDGADEIEWGPGVGDAPNTTFR